MCNSIVAGVDIGGSHITVALVDADKRVVLEETQTRLEIDSKGPAEAIIAAWCKAIETSCRAYGGLVGHIGIAMPGPFDYDEGISLMKNQDKYDSLYGLNIKKLLGEKLAVPVENIVTTNDAACFLQGELFGGVAQGCKNVFGLTLGTGLGSARTRNGGVEDADLWCSAFREGIAEDYLSSRWFIQRFAEIAGKKVSGVKDLVALAGKDQVARQLFETFGQNLGAFLLPYLVREETEMVVLGGNITQAYDLFAEALRQYLQGNSVQVAVRQTVLGENAALIGAASYCLVKDAVAIH